MATTKTTKKLAENTLRDAVISFYQGFADYEDVHAAVRLARLNGVTHERVRLIHDDGERIARAMTLSSLFGKPKRGNAASPKRNPKRNRIR